jgi:hypothetical protein
MLLTLLLLVLLLLVELLELLLDLRTVTLLDVQHV